MKGRADRCRACGQVAFRQACMDLHRHEGDTWEAWGWGMVRAGLAAVAEVETKRAAGMTEAQVVMSTPGPYRQQAKSVYRRNRELAELARAGAP